MSLQRNPFAFWQINRTEASPHSETLKGSFGRKVWDAFWVVAGTANLLAIFSQKIVGKSLSLRFSFGVLDYLTFPALFIPTILEVSSLMFLSYVAEEKHSPWLKYILGPIAFLIAASISLPKALLAAIIVLNPLSLIVIGIVQLVAQHYAAPLKQKVQDMPMSPELNPPGEKVAGVVTRGSLTNLKLNSVFFINGNHHESTLKFSKISQPNDDGSFTEVPVMKFSSGSGTYYALLFKSSPNNADCRELTESMRAYLELNLDDATEMIESYATPDSKDRQVIRALSDFTTEEINLLKETLDGKTLQAMPEINLSNYQISLFTEEKITRMKNELSTSKNEMAKKLSAKLISPSENFAIAQEVVKSLKRQAPAA